MRKYIFILAFLAFTIPTRVAFGQSPKGTIRGTVIDKVTQVTLPGANVLLMNVTPIVGTTTNEAGNFRLEGVAAGRVSLKISFLGYKEVILSNLVLNSGKELVISAEMEEMVMTTKCLALRHGSPEHKTLTSVDRRNLYHYRILRLFY